jgi:hypothetical protein
MTTPSQAPFDAADAVLGAGDHIGRAVPLWERTCRLAGAGEQQAQYWYGQSGWLMFRRSLTQGST